MKMFTRVPDVFLYRDFVDFRKSINGLSTIVEQQMQCSPLDGSVYVFCNKAAINLKFYIGIKPVLPCGTSVLKKTNSSGQPSWANNQ